MAPHLRDIFESGCSEWIEERYTHPGMQCDACLKQIVGRSERHDKNHEFYWVQYRRYSLPPLKGEDFELLRRFRTLQSSDSFYLHYPWLFSPDIFDQLIDGTEAQDHQRLIVCQMRENYQDDEFQLVLDMYIRQMGFEGWNWRQVQERTQPLVDIQLVCAEYSPHFYDLYKALSEQSDSSRGLSEMTANQVVALKKQLRDSDLGQDELTLCKRAFQNYASVHEELLGSGQVGTYDDRVSNRARYLETLSMRFDVRIPLSP
ncbi:MAG: hypothetical protein M1813_002315 [Trichoglossum hirsutum]|nr:MAG: hypothetical protein M1813_002315 [Trichoglossum hirsutum]